MRPRLRTVNIAVLLVSASCVFADDPARLPDEALVLAGVARYGRAPMPIDAVQAKFAAGDWRAPKEGDALTAPGGQERKWVKAAVKDGALDHPALNGGYAFFVVESPADRVMLLQAAGSTVSYVNGEPRVGDVYSHGYVTVPVALRKGENQFLFHCGRGSLRAKLVEPTARIQF